MRLEQHVRDNPGKYGDNFKLLRKYQREINDLMARESQQNQANPQAWMNAFSLIKGFHDEDISEARKSGDTEFFGEAPAKGAPAVPPDKSNEITDRDRENAKRWGVTPEQVQSSRKSLTFGDEPVKGF